MKQRNGLFWRRPELLAFIASLMFLLWIFILPISALFFGFNGTIFCIVYIIIAIYTFHISRIRAFDYIWECPKCGTRMLAVKVDGVQNVKNMGEIE